MAMGLHGASRGRGRRGSRRAPMAEINVTPFVDVIVDLDDGAHIKGTLVDVDPDAVSADMPVRMVFREAVPAGADKPYLTYLFVPAQGAAA